jgi:hypothetical protein
VKPQIIDAFRRPATLPIPTPAACQPPHSAATPQGDPSWLPLTPRGQANSKVSHPSGDCNGNFPCTADHAELSPRVSLRRARCVGPPCPRLSGIRARRCGPVIGHGRPRCTIEGDGIPTDQRDITVETDLVAVELSDHIAVQAKTYCSGGAG